MALSTVSEYKHREWLLGLVWSLVVGLCGCHLGLPADVARHQLNALSTDPQNWYIYYSSGVPLHPSSCDQGAWSFRFPGSEGGGHVNYVQTPVYATTQPQSVTITFKVDSNAPIYEVLDPRDVSPATFRVFFERQNDDLVDPNGRWWANESMYNLGSQDGRVLSITVPFSPDRWTNVQGEQDPRAFASALQNIGWIGLTFGGQYFAGHGVTMKDGTASYILVDYSVN